METPLFINFIDVFIYDNNMMSGLSPEDYIIKKQRQEESAY